jgi:hypothetical protein
MQNQALLYSPYLPEIYSRPCSDGRAGIGYELRSVASRPLWNLYWLSEPRLDEFLKGGPSSLIDFQMYGACKVALEQTVCGEFVRDLVLGLPASVFVQRVKANPHQHLAPYELRGRAWLHALVKRASAARGVQREDANVLYAGFGGRAPVTTPGHSARIMTLALRKR